MSPYETGDICIEPERLQRVAVISLEYASRGRPSHHRLPQRVRDRVLQLARTTYAGFDHHLCEKLVGQEGLSLGRETLRRLLRSAGICSPRKRRAPTHRQRRPAHAREGEMLLLDGSFHRWLEDRGPQLTLLGFLDDVTRKVPVAEFFPTEDARGYFRLLRRLLRRFGVPLSFYGDRHGVFVRNDDHWTCFNHQRSVSKDNVVQWDGRRFQIPPQPHRFSFAGARIQLLESLEGKVAIYYGNNELHHTEGVTFSSGR